VVLAGGEPLRLTANLAQAQPTAWGRIVAAVPPGAFLVTVSMIERRDPAPGPPPPRTMARASRSRRDGRPRCRTIEIQAGSRTITAADPLPDDLRTALRRIHDRSAAH